MIHTCRHHNHALVFLMKYRIIFKKRFNTFTMWPYWFRPRVWTPNSRAMNLFHKEGAWTSETRIFFLNTYRGREVKIWPILHIWSCEWDLGGGKVIILTMYITLIVEMLHTINGSNWHCGFKKKLKIITFLKAISHLSDAH